MNQNFEDVKIGDVVTNLSSGCSFVVEKSDVSMINDNKWNYRKELESYGELNSKLLEEIVTIKTGLFKLFRQKAKIMSDPDDGIVKFAIGLPFCLSCKKGLLFDHRIICEY